MPPASLDISRLWTTLTIILIVCLSGVRNIVPSATSTSDNISYNSKVHSGAAPNNSHSSNANDGAASDIWSDLGKIVQFVLDKCTAKIRNDENPNRKNSSRSDSMMILEDCLKKRSLLAVDRALKRDVISIGDGALVFKWKNPSENTTVPRSWAYTEKENNLIDWGEKIKHRLIQFFKTRAVKIRISNLNLSDMAQPRDNFEGRGRRRGNMMAQLLMFALVAAGIIVIPMGFQFLAVLGGKALLLAKLALLLTSIQGLKKIATSQFNYGLYSHGGGGGPWNYDRKWPYEYDGYQNRHTAGVDSFGHPDLLHPLQPRIQDVINA